MDVRISPLGLDGILGLPRPAGGLVLFAHGSGSGRFSPRNTYVAAALRSAGLATLLFDLLTEDGGRRSQERLRHRAARRASRAGHGLGRTAGGYRGPADRLFRRQHRRGGGAGRRGAAAGGGWRHRLAWRPPRHGWPGARPGARSDAAHRGRAGRRRAGAEPAGVCPSCGARGASRSCRAPRTCSRSRARSIR